MQIKILILTLLNLFIFSTNSWAFEQKDINNFKKLTDFSSVQEFEKYYHSYTQECLDNGFGGTGSIHCFVAYKLWDKELNISYNQLLSQLSTDERELLVSSQKAWLKSRDLTINLNSKLLDKIYDEEGTMYLLMRARDADSTVSAIIKERTLFLKYWAKIMNSKKP